MHPILWLHKIRLQLYLINADLRQILFTKQSSDKHKTENSASFNIKCFKNNDK